MVAVLSKLRAALGIAVTQLRHSRGRTVLTVLGITLAVLSTTLLAGTGIGVVETGQQKFDASGRDLWISGGAVRFAPGTVGGIENSITDAHQLEQELRQREDVATATPMSFQTVYVSTNGTEFETVIGVGAPAKKAAVQLSSGPGFTKDDVHYGNGSYDGPMTNEVVVGQRVAEQYDIEVGDTLYVGGTLASAREHRFTVVGVSPTFSQFLGAPSVVLHLSELQEVTGTTGTDSATLVTVRLRDGADPAQVAAEIEREYPQYDVRTNQEQLTKTLEEQATVLAAGASLVLLAVVSGLALTLNLLLTHVHQQRRELAALKALGMSSSTLATAIGAQSLLLGVLGGLVGVGLSYPAVEVLNYVAYAVVGFDDVVRLPGVVLVGGFGLAVGTSLLGSLAAGWRTSRLSPLKYL